MQSYHNSKINSGAMFPGLPYACITANVVFLLLFGIFLCMAINRAMVNLPVF